jgi:FMN-dependent NADH-azoreductase
MSAANATRLLRIDASMRFDGSTTRTLADKLVDALGEKLGHVDIVNRDLAVAAPNFVDAAWIGANFTDPAERSDTQKEALAASDALVAKLKAADVLVIASPIYNFSVPAALKAWIDMVARARETFRYTPEGPKGLLEGKKAYLVIASGGTPIQSEIDFATDYLKHIMGFIGIQDVEIIAAGRQMADANAAIAGATAAIEAVKAA